MNNDFENRLVKLEKQVDKNALNIALVGIICGAAIGFLFAKIF